MLLFGYIYPKLGSKLVRTSKFKRKMDMIPLVGAIGGAYDVVYLKQIME